MFVDSHCHLDMLKSDLDTALYQARLEDVEHVLNVSVDLARFPQVLAAARTYPYVSASVGIHPSSSRDGESDTAHLVELAADPEVVAIGETGLDYYYNQGDLEWQRERFRYHIRAARETAKPLIIHNRDAKHDTLRILREENAAAVGGVMHCFVEDWDTAQQAMDLGFYISFSGIVTFKTATDLKTVAKQVPLERLLIETDSPYLTPVPYRGKPNQPAYVRHVAEHLAELRGDSVDNIAACTTQNFYTLFKLPPG